MKLTLKTLRKAGPFFALVVVFLLLAGCAPGAAEEADLASVPTFDTVVAVEDSADDDQSQAVQIIGAVQSFDGAVLRVNGLSIDTSAASFQGAVAEGATVQVQGRQAAGGTIAAEYIWVLQPPAELTPTAVPTSTVPFVIEGRLTRSAAGACVYMASTWSWTTMPACTRCRSATYSAWAATSTRTSSTTCSMTGLTTILTTISMSPCATHTGLPE